MAWKSFDYSLKHVAGRLADQVLPRPITDEEYAAEMWPIEEPITDVVELKDPLPRYRASRGLELILGRMGLELEFDDETLDDVILKQGVPEKRLPYISLVVAPTTTAALRYKHRLGTELIVDPEDKTVLPRYVCQQEVTIGLVMDDAQHKDVQPVNTVAAASLHRAAGQAAWFYDLDRRWMPGLVTQLAVGGARLALGQERQGPPVPALDGIRLRTAEPDV